MKKIYRFVFAAALVLLFAGVFTGAAAAADASAAGQTDNATVFTGNADNAVDSAQSQSGVYQAWERYKEACNQYDDAQIACRIANEALDAAKASGDKNKIIEASNNIKIAKVNLDTARYAKEVAEREYIEIEKKARGAGAPAPC